MSGFFKIDKELHRSKNHSGHLAYFNDKKSLAYHKVNHLRNPSYSTSLSTEDTPKINTLYINGDNKTYKVINFKNESMASVFTAEIPASDDRIPNILAQLAQNNPNEEMEFYENPVDLIKTIRDTLYSINHLFIFSKKCKDALFQTANDLNQFLNADEATRSLQYTQFLESFLKLIQEVEQNKPVAWRLAVGKLSAYFSSPLFLFGGASMIGIGAVSSPVLLIAGIVLVLIGFTLMITMLVTSSYGYESVYNPKNSAETMKSLYTQASFFSENLNNEKEVVVSEVQEAGSKIELN